MDCIFCKIAQGEIPAYRVWEDQDHLAFLDIFPNTPGMTVVIPKKHHPSDVFALPPKTFTALMNAGRQVARLLDKKLKVERTALIVEGTEIDHVHLKLYPLWGYRQNQKKKYPPYRPVSVKEYQGWLTSKAGPAANQAELKKICRKIIN